MLLKNYFTGFHFLFSCIICSSPAFSQEADYYLGRNRYSFIDYTQNRFILPVNATDFVRFYDKIDSAVAYGKGKVQIVHMGGSHLQADIYTHIARKHLQELSPDMNGGRGLIFPMKIAGMYNPSNFGVLYSGLWTHCLSTQRTSTCRLGLTGISVSTTDSLASITVSPGKDSTLHYLFNQVRVFHEPTTYEIAVLANDTIISGKYDSIMGLTLFTLKQPADVLKLLIRKTTSDQFTLQGISLDSDFPGVVYNAIGINGAMLGSYLRCELYGLHLRAIHPDLVIFSIGTNDGNTRKFDKEKYRMEYTQLIESTINSVPDAAILLTIPNDCYIYRQYVNQNTKVMREVILDLAQKYNCAVWDFYSIMGGLNSSQAWREANLMQNDKIHFNRIGYELKGELFFSAFLKGWENHLNETSVITNVALMSNR